MPTQIPPQRHDHIFLGKQHDRHERRTWWVVALTAAMMVAEIAGGTLFGSMALVADGWHMSTHAAALAIAAYAYRIARRYQHDSRFTFGTGKIGELAAFASAVLLLLVALLIGYESAIRLANPVPIRFTEALPIAVLGLLVNLLSAWLLGHGHDHDHEHDHERQAAAEHPDNAQHDHSAHHPHFETGSHGPSHDSNIRAAYVHVLADALTSVFAIIALLAGYYAGLNWLDPVMGLLGMAVIAHWSINLLKTSGRVLLDVVPDPLLLSRIQQKLENQGVRITDLHLWRLGPEHLGLIVSITGQPAYSPDHYKQLLHGFDQLAHITIEVHHEHDIAQGLIPPSPPDAAHH